MAASWYPAAVVLLDLMSSLLGRQVKAPPGGTYG